MGDGDLSKYHDEYREALNRLIEAKLAGEVLEAPELPKAAEAVDLAEQLLASLQS